MVETILQLVGKELLISVATIIAIFLIPIVFLLLNRRSIRRIKNLLTILDNGSYQSCPFFLKCAQSGGKRWYDDLID